MLFGIWHRKGPGDARSIDVMPVVDLDSRSKVMSGVVCALDVIYWPLNMQVREVCLRYVHDEKSLINSTIELKD